MTFELFLAKKAIHIQPCIGDEVMIILPSGMMLCTYLGMKIITGGDIKHIYDYRGETVEASAQVALPYDDACEILN